MELYEDIHETAFSFGENWQNFLQKLDQRKVDEAENYLSNFFTSWGQSIAGKTVVDIGCWSGLMSLWFINAWASKVVSIDIDKKSIECALHLKQKYNISDEKRTIITGSVLDQAFIKQLWTFDIIYSWGVIHHSGNMWQGLKNILTLEHLWSVFYIAIYNTNTIVKEGTSSFREKVKKIYSKHHIIRPFIKLAYTAYLLLGLVVTKKNPVSYIRNYDSLRGMNFFTDIEDRLGGYPYEHASYEQIITFYSKAGYSLAHGLQVRSIWCNEFLFTR